MIIALIGPTAVGKTAVSLELAKRLNAEIVNCDSMQVYQYMLRLSQAPTESERAAVPHHLFGFVDPAEQFNAGSYRDAALPTIKAIQARGKAVLIVGGTGLYLRAITSGLCDAPPQDAAIREALEQLPLQELCSRLQKIDAEAAAKIHAHDARRMVRALEVYEITGSPLSTWWSKTQEAAGLGQIPTLVLNRSRELLYTRINQRLLHMLEREGIIDEAQALLQRPLAQTARQVHGLRDLEAYFKHEVDWDAMIVTWQQRVRNYAKRQLTWFRQIPNAHWQTIAPDQSTAAVAQDLCALIS